LATYNIRFVCIVFTTVHYFMIIICVGFGEQSEQLLFVFVLWLLHCYLSIQW